jgi:hypothetical protein
MRGLPLPIDAKRAMLREHDKAVVFKLLERFPDLAETHPDFVCGLPI